jgi:hypothetical protein
MAWQQPKSQGVSAARQQLAATGRLCYNARTHVYHGATPAYKQLPKSTLTCTWTSPQPLLQSLTRWRALAPASWAAAVAARTPWRRRRAHASWAGRPTRCSLRHRSDAAASTAGATPATTTPLLRTCATRGGPSHRLHASASRTPLRPLITRFSRREHADSTTWISATATRTEWSPSAAAQHPAAYPRCASSGSVLKPPLL